MNNAGLKIFESRSLYRMEIKHDFLLFHQWLKHQYDSEFHEMLIANLNAKKIDDENSIFAGCS